jgi:hypothetical protein
MMGAFAPAFAVGDIIRYASGVTAIMCVTQVLANHGGRGFHRYLGVTCQGGSAGAYQYDCHSPSEADIARWNSYKPDRMRVGYAV